MLTRIAAGLALMAFGLATFAADLQKNEFIIGGGSCESDGLKISGPSLYLRRSTPCVTFAMVKVPGKEARLAYSLVIKGEEQCKTLPLYESKSSVSGPTANSFGFVQIAGKKIAFDYRVNLDPSGKAEPREVLTINSKAFDLNKGRNVLIDLSAKEVKWTQSVAELPKSAQWPITTLQLERQAKHLIDRVAR